MSINTYYYSITLINGFDSQTINLYNKDEAKETADRLNFFFKTTGNKTEVLLQEVKVDVSYDDDGNPDINETYQELSY
jgi:allophanate hydrolase subunit 1